jgi:hypothetical protein
MKNHLVFQCYGKDVVFHECALALLSLCRVHDQDALKNIQVHIYTDRPEWFDRLRIDGLALHLITMDSATIQSWRGKIDFVHRVKVAMLMDFSQQHEGNILYCDDDVIFTRTLAPVFKQMDAGNLFMHVMEGRISNGANPMLIKLDRFLKKSHLSSSPPLSTLRHVDMWNAGVLGFTTRQSEILGHVLSFTDHVYPHFPKHIVEQFAFSVFFQQSGSVKTASPYVLHYWNLKEARELIASFFDHFKDYTWQQLVQLSALIQMPVLMQEKANFYQGRSMLGKLQKQNWQPAIPDWHQSMKQL